MTALDTAQQTDTETIEHLDFEAALMCDVRRPDCSAPAAFVIRCRRCGWSMLICAPHRGQIERAVIRVGGVICGSCRASARRAADVIEFIPIGGAS